MGGPIVQVGSGNGLPSSEGVQIAFGGQQAFDIESSTASSIEQSQVNKNDNSGISDGSRKQMDK